MDPVLARSLHQPAESKILLLVLDGLGGLPHPDTGRSELQTAHTPNLDRLARRSELGLTLPVGLGITPGSGPGHLALFGYDPLTVRIGRGVLEAVGIDFDLRPSDIAARGNFCTLNADGRITDRRAGRISTERAAALVDRLRAIDVGDGIQVLVEPVREHRLVLVLRGEGLSDAVTETDPQRTGVAPLVSHSAASGAAPPGAARTAAAINRFVEAAHGRLADVVPANGLLLRGFAQAPDLPQMRDLWGIAPASCALYPMYRGLAKLAGMTALPAGQSLPDQIASLAAHWPRFDFFFLHYKYTDSAGEDGDFAAKVARLEEVDRHLPALLDLNPDVLLIAGDHSTPAVLAAHSWHPVPFLLHSPHARFHPDATFDEPSCAHGALGIFPAREALPLALAHAGRFRKYGA